MLRRHLCAGWIAALSFFAPVSRAEETTSPDAVDAAEPTGERLRRVAIVENALGLLIGLWSLEVQLVPIRHQVIALNARALFTEAPPSLAFGLRARHAFGFELDYRYYTGTRGPNGFFVGPYFSWWTVQEPADPEAGPRNEWNATTVGFDCGYQHMSSGGFLVGGGAGVGPWWSSKAATNPTFVPRLLMSIGYAF